MIKDFLILFIIFTLSFTLYNQPEKKVKEVNRHYYDCKSVVCYDKTNDVILYEQNATILLPPASLSKVLTLICALENLDLSRYVIIDKKMISVDGSRLYLEEHEVIYLKDLLYGLMLQSGNDCALAIAYTYSPNILDFIELMNKTCKIAGMNCSYFNNPHGLDELSYNMVTSLDMARLFSYGLDNNLFREIVSSKSYSFTSLTGRKFSFYNKHKLVRMFEGCAGKTGFTKKAGRTLVTSFKEDDAEIVCVTLDCPNDWAVHLDLKSRFLDARLKKTNRCLPTNFYFNFLDQGYYA